MSGVGTAWMTHTIPVLSESRRAPVLHTKGVSTQHVLQLGEPVFHIKKDIFF